MKRLWQVTMTVLLVTAAWTVPVVAQGPTQIDEFVPVGPGDLQEQIPVAPLVFAAYAIVWLVFAFYLFSVWRRVSRVEAELRSVTAKLEKNRR